MSDGPPDSILDDIVSRALKEEGMSRVLRRSGPFLNQFYQYVLSLPLGWIGLIEDIRDDWAGITPKPQAWGAATNSMIKLGLLIHIDMRGPMKAKKSHSRDTAYLQRVQPSHDPKFPKPRKRRTPQRGKELVQE